MKIPNQQSNQDLGYLLMQFRVFTLYMYILFLKYCFYFQLTVKVTNVIMVLLKGHLLSLFLVIIIHDGEAFFGKGSRKYTVPNYFSDF